nr:MAG TPA: hypothetical protein [Caudoviricetes sp.]
MDYPAYLTLSGTYKKGEVSPALKRMRARALTYEMMISSEANHQDCST